MGEELEKYVECLGEEKIERVLRFRVKKDVDLYTAIENVIRAERVENGLIIGGIGALDFGVLRNVHRKPAKYPVQPEDRFYYRLDRPMELLSLSGWIAPDNQDNPHLHLHYSVSTVEADGESLQVAGGHLEKNATRTWVAVVVTVLVFAKGSGAQARLEKDTKMVDLFY